MYNKNVFMKVIYTCLDWEKDWLFLINYHVGNMYVQNNHLK
jgi:hypothetical protein